MRLAAALALVLALSAGCKREGQFGVNLPRYPGANYSPGDRTELPRATLYRATLHHPHGYTAVRDWYEGELSKLPGWSGPKKARELSVWTNGNMGIGDDFRGEVKDPSRPGGLVVITETAQGSRVILVESVPKKE